MNSIRRSVGFMTMTALLGVFASCGDDGPTSEQSTASVATTPVSAVGSAAEVAYPVTVTSCGRDYVYEAAPQRVVAGSPTSVETLAALGVDGSVVGYVSGDFGRAPGGDVPELSPSYVPPREVLLGAKPDLVVANAEMQVGGEDGGASIDDLQQAGSNVYVLGEYCLDAPGATGVDAVYADVEHLGAIFGVPDIAEALVDELEQRVAAAAALRGDAAPMRVAYVQVYDGTMYALAGAGYAATLDAIGAVNVFADLEENFAEISPEKVLTLDADGIVFVYDFAGDEATARAEIDELLGASTAVQSGIVVGVPSDLPEGAGVTVVDIIERVANGLYK